VDEDSAGPEVYFGTEEFFYNNLELLFSEYNNVEEGKENSRLMKVLQGSPVL
jgi:hypothetical protein